MKAYELVAISSVKEDPTKTVERVEELLSKHGASASEKQDLGDRALAFPIKKEDRGFYQIFSIEMDKEKVPSLESDLRLQPDLLRFAIFTKSA